MAVVAALALGACQVRTDVDVAVEPDGSGTVTVTARLDADAVEQLGADPADAIRLDDLRAAGWEIDGPRADGADTVIEASKPFGRADALGPVMAQLGGADGPFRDWSLATDSSFTVSTYELEGTVHLTGSLDQFSDTDVAAALDGFALGRSPEEIAAALEADPEAFRLGVEVRLPGSFDHVEGLDAVEDTDGVARTTIVLGSGEETTTDVVLRSSESDRSSVLWMLVGGGLIVCSLVLVITAQRVARRRANGRSGRRPGPTTAPSS